MTPETKATDMAIARRLINIVFFISFTSFFYW